MVFVLTMRCAIPDCCCVEQRNSLVYTTLTPTECKSQTTKSTSLLARELKFSANDSHSQPNVWWTKQNRENTYTEYWAQFAHGHLLGTLYGGSYLLLVLRPKIKQLVSRSIKQRWHCDGIHLLWEIRQYLTNYGIVALGNLWLWKQIKTSQWEILMN